MTKERRIIGLFCYEAALRFSEIEHRTGLRSNEVAYYIDRLVRRGVLVKSDDRYALSAHAMKQLPYFDEADALCPLPIVLVRCVRQDGAALLHKRTKRPYSGLWSMPGGRIELGESVAMAVKRLLKEIAFLDCTVEGVRAVANERVIEDGVTKHGFLMMVVDVTPTSIAVPKPTIRWVQPGSVDPVGVIPSDHFFLDAAPGVYECVLTPRGDFEFDSIITKVAESAIQTQR